MTPVEKIQHILNREELALDSLISQFKGKENIEKLVKIFSKEAQLLEDVVYQLLELRYLNNATGDQLDQIGKRLGIIRTSHSDEIFRTSIKVKALSKRNEGTTENVLELLRLISGDPNVSVYNFEPYGVVATYNSTCVPENRVEQLSSLFPVVTDLYLEEFITSKGFGFSSIDNPNPDISTVGYGPFSSIAAEGDPLTEGTFVSLVHPTT
jgi:hypothetical protein